MIELKDKNLFLLITVGSDFTLKEYFKNIENYKLFAFINYSGDLFNKILVKNKNKIIIYESLEDKIREISDDNEFIFIISEPENISKIYDEIRKTYKKPIIFISEGICDEKEEFDNRYLFYYKFTKEENNKYLIKNIDTNLVMSINNLKKLNDRKIMIENILKND